MPRVGDELLLELAGAGEGARHRVEGAGQAGDLVLGVLLDGDADVQVLGACHPFDGLGELVDGTQAGAGDEEACGTGAEDSDAGDEEEDQGEFVEGGLGSLEGVARTRATPWESFVSMPRYRVSTRTESPFASVPLRK